jgi:hypothetical protein
LLLKAGNEKDKMKWRSSRRRSRNNHDRANRRYITKEIGKLLSEIWRVKGLAEQEYGMQHPITKKLASMHEDAQKLLRD